MRTSKGGPYFKGQRASSCGHYYPDVQRLRDERRKDGTLVRLIQCRWCGRSEVIINPKQFLQSGVEELSIKGISLISNEETWLDSRENVRQVNSLAAFTLGVLANFAEIIPFVISSRSKNLDPQAGYALLMRTLELFITLIFDSLHLPSVPKSHNADDLLNEMNKHKALPQKLLDEMVQLMDKRGLLIHALESPVTSAMLHHDTLRVAGLISWYWFEFQREHRVTHLDVPDQSVRRIAEFDQSRKLFLCYAREDFKRVARLYEVLKKRGHNPWMDKEDLLPGQNWEETVQKVIHTSDFLSPVYRRQV